MAYRQESFTPTSCAVLNEQLTRFLSENCDPEPAVGSREGPQMSARVRPSVIVITSTLLLATFMTWMAPVANAATPPLPVDLKTSANYSVLAGSEITNTLSTELQVDLGVSPGTAITGFPPGVTHGETHIGDLVSQQAQSDARAAYTDAKNRIFTDTISGDIAGLTFKSGVFQAASALDVSADGIVTLDGEHDDNSVFIFQVGSALNLGARTRIELTNGAQACHVFWQVGSAATIGEASAFAGTILADAAITVGATTTVDGRALAGTAITLSDNDFVSGPCSSAPAGGGTGGSGGSGGGAGGGTGGSGGSGGDAGGGTGGSGGASGGAGGGTGGGSGGSSGGAGGSGASSGGQSLPSTGAGLYDAGLLAVGLALTLAGAIFVAESRRRPGARRRVPGAHALRV